MLLFLQRIFNMIKLQNKNNKMLEIKLDELTKEQLPKDPFHCYLICNRTIPTEELLDTIISSLVKETDFCGKFGVTWEDVEDRVCVKRENDESKNDDQLVITCNFQGTAKYKASGVKQSKCFRG